MKVLITGGTGSYGQAFVRHILKQGPRRVVIYSRSEHTQEMLARSLGAWGVNHSVLRFFIGDVRDRDRLDYAMHGIDTVVHAAALKIVPTAEYNPTECVATNVGGAENVVKAAINAGVERVLALSTDKAVNPVNLYGATKLAAEKIFIAANALAAGRTRFSVMRYGNVVGSRGSVVPLFKELAERGEPIPVTDERMTRFWITLDQAVEFTTSCLAMMNGREIFIPKIPSMRIVDLANEIVSCAHLMLPQPIKLNTGIRPGEKLHECLMTEDEARTAYATDKYFVITPDAIGNLLEGFRYSSDTNKEWVTPDQLEEWIS